MNILKKFFKNFILLCAVLSMSGCSVPFPTEVHEIEAPAVPKVNTKPEIICVADEMHESEWYAELCASLMEFNTSCIVNDNVGNRDVGKAIAQLMNDCPEIFWTGRTYYGKTVTDGSEIVFSRPEWFEWEDVPDMYNELVAAADKLIEGVPDGSDYDKILYIHDYIAENTVYDYEAAERGTNELAGTAYGCLVQGKAVCEGYAEAFQYIMNRIGIESGVCIGSNHAWNYVNADGEYYWIDVTWDDSDESHTEHTYFLVNDEMLLRSRTFQTTQGYVPDCTSLDNNYFVQNGGYFTSYDKNEVVSYIESAGESGRCEIMFADFETYSTALYSLFQDGDVRKADNIGHKALTYYRNDDMFTFDIIY